jgi:hypothetical protein
MQQLHAPYTIDACTRHSPENYLTRTEIRRSFYGAELDLAIASHAKTT